MAEWEGTSTKFADKKKYTSMGRRIIGMGVSSGGIWTGNIRALRHVLSMRTDAAAEEEIQHVFCMIADHMIAQEPTLFGDFTKQEDGSFKPKYWKV